LKQVSKLILEVKKFVKKMVQECNENIIPPPLEFRDNYKLVAAPRIKKHTCCS